MKRSDWAAYQRRLRNWENKYAPRIYRALIGQAKAFTQGLREGRQELTIINEKIAGILRLIHVQVATSEGRLRLRELRQTEVKRYSLGTNEEWVREVIDRLYFHQASFVAAITETTREYLLEQVAKGLEEGLSLNEIAELLDRQVEQIYKNRSFAIARTEVVRAANFGTQLASEKYEYVVEKTWITAKDHRVRGRKPKDKFDHWILNGNKVDSDSAFNNGEIIRFPGDPEASPGNTINCRCTISLTGKRDINGRLIPKPSRLFSTI